jgi:CRISPR-associated protein Cas2
VEGYNQKKRKEDNHLLSWWFEAFPLLPSPSESRGHPAGVLKMLTIVAYDICDSKRLKKVADCCLDFGVRVEYSVFECRLEADQFDRMWNRLINLIEPEEDRIVAYPIHGADIQKIRSYGTFVGSKKVISYIF